MKRKRFLAFCMSLAIGVSLVSCEDEAPPVIVSTKEPEEIWRTLEEYRTVYTEVPYTVEMSSDAVLYKVTRQGADRLYEAFRQEVEAYGATEKNYDVRLAYLFQNTWEAAQRLDEKISSNCNSARTQLVRRMAEFVAELQKEEKFLQAFLLYFAMYDVGSSYFPSDLQIGDGPLEMKKILSTLEAYSYESMTPDQRKALRVGDIVAAGEVPSRNSFPILWRVENISSEGVELKSLFVVDRIAYRDKPVQTMADAAKLESGRQPNIFQLFPGEGIYASFSQEGISYLQKYRPSCSAPKMDLRWIGSDLHNYLVQKIGNEMSIKERGLILYTPWGNQDDAFGENSMVSVYVSDSVETELLYWVQAARGEYERTLEIDGFYTYEGIWCLKRAEWEYRAPGVSDTVEQHSLLAVSPRAEKIYSEYMLKGMDGSGALSFLSSPYSIYSALDGESVLCEVQNPCGVVPRMWMSFGNA